MSRKITDYLIIAFKGLAIGATDAVPGVSGGTIAFISGIYKELITSISSFTWRNFKLLINSGVLVFWKAINGNFLLALFTGILISYVTFMKLAKYLLEHHPVLIWSFFFGLILASIYFVWKQITAWNLTNLLALIFGTVAAYIICELPALEQNNSPVFLFLSGALAICAMILPGISGSFILIVLGAYKGLSDAINDIEIKKLLAFFLGAVIGLLSFSHVLKWLFKHYYNITLAILTGFIFGSLNKIWPWKKTLSWYTDSKGIQIPLAQQSVSPFNFEGDNHLILSIILMIIGILIIFILEKMGSKYKHAKHENI